MNPKESHLLNPDAAFIARVLAGLGVAAFVAGLYWAPHRAWASLLWSNFYFLSLALAGGVFVALMHASAAGWATVFRRVPEAMTSYLRAGMALMAALFFGLKHLYPWASPGATTNDAVLRAKLPFLSGAGFLVIVVAAAAAWLLPMDALLRHSRAQDLDGDPAHTIRSRGLSAAFLLLFALAFTLACVQWLMSLEPHWYSTMYPWYVFAGLLAQGTAALTLLVIILRRAGGLPEVNPNHLHDLGKLLFAFSAFWAYLWFSQGLLIWYSNMPEETTHYASRLIPSWRLLFWANPLVNFALPLILLLRARSKKHERTLIAAAVAMLLGRALDTFLLIMPAVMEKGPFLGWTEVGVFIGLGGAFLLIFDRAFSGAPAIPVKDPYLQESLHHAG